VPTVSNALLQFRFATAADAAVVADLVESGYRGERSRAGWTTEADLLDGQRTSIEGVLEVLGQPGSHILLGERGGADGRLELIASAQLERQPAHAYFGMFSVRPGLQNGGYGRQVLDEAERIARQVWGLVEMRMSVIEQRAELIAWYERRGYARTGEFLPFPYGDERFGLPKRPDLRFAVLAKPLR
jgi:ribosomal protein S18 acetylase RimI-like enzyme